MAARCGFGDMAARVDGKQCTGRRCGGLIGVGRRRCSGDTHVAGEEAAWRAATCVGERGEVSGELGPATARGRAMAGAESSRPATRQRMAQRGVSSASTEWAAPDVDAEVAAHHARASVGARGFRPATSGVSFGQLLLARCGFYPCRTATGEHHPGQPMGRQRRPSKPLIGGSRASAIFKI
jgi:hypothetical protein